METALGDIANRQNGDPTIKPQFYDLIMGYPIGWTNTQEDIIGEIQNFEALQNQPKNNAELLQIAYQGKMPKNKGKMIKASGNAIVPQVAYQIFKAINEININQ